MLIAEFSKSPGHDAANHREDNHENANENLAIPLDHFATLFEGEALHVVHFVSSATYSEMNAPCFAYVTLRVNPLTVIVLSYPKRLLGHILLYFVNQAFLCHVF